MAGDDNAAQHFHYFNKLPVELRLQIWEHHFSRLRRIHVVHAESRQPESLGRRWFSLDSSEVRLPRDLPLNINHEAWAVAMARERRTEVLHLARDMTIGSCEERGGLRLFEETFPHLVGYEGRARPAVIDVSTDLVYLLFPDTFRPLLRSDSLLVAMAQPWARKIQRLALHFGIHALAYETDQMNRRDVNMVSVFDMLTSLSELLLVLDPSPGVNMAGLPRDDDGFVEWDQERDGYGANRKIMAIADAYEKAFRKAKRPVVVKKLVNVAYRLSNGQLKYHETNLSKRFYSRSILYSMAS
ncbi:hypothetical protein F4809DRAFT_646810 [Biscogniauxia mediterranea]|nr:hypothetical protein F4809DRAFT_646810 [Biscogniauxia mediterranea]